MSRIIAVVGESGSGKSTSMRNLNPQTSVILSPITKELPFQGEWSKENKNYFQDLKAPGIATYLTNISEKAKDVKVVVIDDFQYLMATEFMARAYEKGYDKFTEMAKNTYEVIMHAKKLRDDLNIYFLTHSESDGDSRVMKTLGKLLREKITLEGLFTVVLFTSVDNGEYQFQTQTDGMTTAKSPIGMLESIEPNDLVVIDKKIREYYAPKKNKKN